MSEVKATMPGNVWKVIVEVDDEVTEDQDIVILESMKMEIPISTGTAGLIQEIKVSEGDFINEGDVIAIIK
ncbi:acetyl-CoA carboxylase biotin carboxyl carrier protein subunit [Siminovitchia terrae]|uniref:Acetyl-CoA carboxylase biotin carboxyl carrier protein subunit n=1 Tax=Siminovitchia terrae TaxID=1914933 RepID=A0A429X3B7_SIMTE|nr:acetyl-CoA carboxylase biotin carboxyl carrier protein subunit [Siminovitchia terrae]RST57864.1 acetyl-CoA carboxylase biotin carboxyl carrier protein subunit [Siminovitchia terrae]GIN92074.1 acetyl-CoA carboxylase biotin carboxyl carrier protein subunit [Siminovitchia terrae]GIN98300.1 acetyl-CoA carboxylase biotin carboxyl carrier protein subunit [Siminovitchia terrae]